MKRSPIQRKAPLRAKAPMNRKREKRQPVQKARRKNAESRFRSERYLRFVRSLPCCACGVLPCDAHHAIGLGWGLSGMGMTAPDSFVISLCRACHTELHNNPGWLHNQPRWLRHTIALGMREFDGEIHEALREALAFIEEKERAA